MQWTTPEEIHWLRFSPSGMLLATSRGFGYSPSQTIRLWDAVAGRELTHLGGIDNTVVLAFGSEREVLFEQRGRCLLWNSETGDVRPVWEGPAISAATMSPDGKTLALALGSVVLVVDFPSCTLRHRLLTPIGTEVWYGNLFATGQFLAAACTHMQESHGVVALWDTRRGKRLRTYELREEAVSGGHDAGALAIHPDGTLLAVSTEQGVRTFGMETEDDLEGFTPFPHGRSLRYSADGSILEVLRGDDKLVRLDARTGAVLVTLNVPATIPWQRGVIDPAGDKVALWTEEGEIEVLDILA